MTSIRCGHLWMLFLCLYDVLYLVRCQHTLLQQECQIPTHCYTLYRADGGGNTWQEASQYCQALGQRLATIPDDVTQAIMRRFTSPSTWAWVGGKRSDDTRWRGVGGDYYNGQIRDNSDILWCTAIKIQPNPQLYNGILATFCEGGPTKNRGVCELPVPVPNCGRDTHTVNVSGICHRVSDVTFRSWNDARQHCVDQYNGKLAYRHLTSANLLIGNFPLNTTFWTGIWRRPWSWITHQGTEQAMTYTRWVPEAGVDRSKICLAIDLTRSSNWIGQNCIGASQFFMCEGDPTTTTSLSSTETSLVLLSTVLSSTSPSVDITTKDLVNGRPLLNYSTPMPPSKPEIAASMSSIDQNTLLAIIGLFAAIILILLATTLYFGLKLKATQKEKSETKDDGEDYYNITGGSRVEAHKASSTPGQKSQHTLEPKTTETSLTTLQYETVYPDSVDQPQIQPAVYDQVTPRQSADVIRDYDSLQRSTRDIPDPTTTTYDQMNFNQ